MIFISYFGSGGVISVLSFLIFICYPNRVKAIEFVTYMLFLTYLMGATKNIYI